MNRKVFAVMPFVILALVIGAYNGLLRIGWDLPMNKAMAQHGAIMVGSFLGTLILLERIVVFKRTWLYIFPVLNGLSILFFLAGMFLPAIYCLLTGSVAMTVIYIYLYRLHRETFILVMMVGALSLFGGYMMLLGTRLYPVSVPFWIAFILLTIIGERLELTKFLPPAKIKIQLLLISIILYFIGLYFDFHDTGQYLIGSSLIIFSIWLAFYDIAFKSVKLTGLHRYIALNLIAGYVWLFITGCLLMLSYELKYIYDAILHAFFLGFTFSMIIAHGPIILPGVAGIARKPYHPALYLWGIILQLSLVSRIVGDFLENINIRQISGLINMIAILGFFMNVLFLMKFGKGDS